MLVHDDGLWILFAALVLDAVIGDPGWLWRRLPHPIVGIGNIIGFLDRTLNRESWSDARRKAAGDATLALLVFGAVVLGWALTAGLQALLPPLWANVALSMIAAIFIAQKSLYQHVAAVRDGLIQNGLDGGRKAVAMIVGRDPEALDEAGVARAAIESCSENFSDGITAPVFWFALLGLPGLIAYKTVNTADSMIGHRTERHGAFGWASARFDDLVNLPASRLSGLLIALAAPLAGGSISRALKTIRRDSSRHRSPNAGWPEAAMAGALDIALAGPRSYPGYTVDDPYMNADGRRDANAGDIDRALRIMAGACLLMGLGVLIAALLLEPLLLDT